MLQQHHVAVQGYMHGTPQGSMYWQTKLVKACWLPAACVGLTTHSRQGSSSVTLQNQIYVGTMPPQRAVAGTCRHQQCHAVYIATEQKHSIPHLTKGHVTCAMLVSE